MSKVTENCIPFVQRYLVKRKTQIMSSQIPTNCIFCKIASKNASADIGFENDEIVVFKDIKPAAKHHYLSIPKEHIENVNSLGTDHKGLLENLVLEGKKVIQEQGGDLNDVLVGFHLPPFNTVRHLHLHVISPASSMSMIQRWIFKPNTWWFASVDQIEEKIKKQAESTAALHNKL